MRVTSIRSLLLFLKDYSGIAIDLALYSLVWKDRRTAFEVLNLEKEIDRILEQLLYTVIVAGRSPATAETLVPIIRLGVAFDRISNAAGDIAALVLRDIPVHPAVRDAILRGDELTVLVKAMDVPPAGIEIEALEENVSRIDVLVLRSGDRYILAPSTDAKIRPGDVVIARGSIDEIEDLARVLGDVEVQKLVRELEKSVLRDVLSEKMEELYDHAQLMLDLAFHSLFNGDTKLVSLVKDLEDQLDSLFIDILRESFTHHNPAIAEYGPSVSIVAKSLETLGDAATMIATTATKGAARQVVEEAGEESRETILELRYQGPKTTLTNLELEDLGAIVLAVQKKDKWVLTPPESTVIEEGDLILAKFYLTTDDVEDRIYQDLKEKRLEIEEE
ncbi:MAG: hypothetical protein F7C32_00280 [Desulfurococcales archaeon]|nr:hypothetical protein [Desulfurococcales archaeon]